MTMTNYDDKTIRDVAQIAHEANRAYCASLGDRSQLPWDDAPEWQRQSAFSGVKFHMANPDAGDAASHENWLRDKEKDGWTFGPVKDAEKKEHPCFVPFDQLPLAQQRKDRLFRSIIHALLDLRGATP